MEQIKSAEIELEACFFVDGHSGEGPNKSGLRRSEILGCRS